MTTKHERVIRVVGRGYSMSEHPAHEPVNRKYYTTYQDFIGTPDLANNLKLYMHEFVLPKYREVIKANCQLLDREENSGTYKLTVTYLYDSGFDIWP